MLKAKLWHKCWLVLSMIKFEHTLFALPFAYLGAILGGLEIRQQLPSWSQLGWITLAMVGARSAAMALNRLIDCKIDGQNPRTRDRALPSGKLSVDFVIGFTVVSLALFLYAAAQLNNLALMLAPLAIACLVIYPYTKRFTWLSHIFLGFTIGMGPAGGWIGVTGQIDNLTLVLMATVAFWICGLDILYACQDCQFDRLHGLYSIPARFGIKAALAVSAGCHIITVLGLIIIYKSSSLSTLFGLGVFVAAVLLCYEHLLVKPNDLSRLNTAFFTMNSIFSLILFIFTLLDVLL